MKGSYRIIVQNAKVRYDFETRRNITIIKGNSATGKTTLVEMIREYYEDGEESGISLSCEKECIVLAGRDWENALAAKKDCIVFIDEGNRFVHTREFARTIQKTDNYYVIVTREGLVNLPYSVEEIYGIRESGKYASIKQVYNEFYRLYGDNIAVSEIAPSKIIVEDSNSGYEFFKGISTDKKYSVVSANGKSNIFSQVLLNKSEDALLIVADGAAFGSEMDRMMKLIYGKKNIFLYLPESFEWLILNSGIIAGQKVEEILDAPQNYIECREYFSWERFFTALLIEKTEHSYLQYTKRRLNPVYLQKQESERICSQMKYIEL